MSVTRSEVDLSELDPILGPVLSSSNGSAESRVLALLVKGISSGTPVEAIRLWTKSRCVDGYMFGSASGSIGGRNESDERRGPTRSRRIRGVAHDMRSLTGSVGCGQLVDSARARVISSSGDGRDVRGGSLDMARRIVVGVLMELPGTGDAVQVRTNVGARAALALMGKMMLSDERGWDSVIMSFARAAAELGVDRRTVTSWTKLLEDRGVVTRPRAQAFVASRFRVKKLSGKRLKFAREWDGVAVGVIDEADEPVAMVLRSVTHPVWTYSDKLGLMHWALLLAATAGVNPQVFSIRPKVEKRLRAELTSEYDLMPSVVVPYLDEILGRLADDIDYGTIDGATGERITARVAKERAMAAYAEQAAANKAAAETATQMKNAGYAALGTLLELHPIPKTPFGCKASALDKRWSDVHVWVDSLHQVVLSEDPTEQERKIVGKLLLKRLVREWGGGGYMAKAQVFADDIGCYIMEAETGVTLETWLSQASADDGSFIPSRRR